MLIETMTKKERGKEILRLREIIMSKDNKMRGLKASKTMLLKKIKKLKSSIKKEMKAEFDLKKIYWHEWTPKRIAKTMSKLLDNKLQVIILPTTKNTCDFVIRDIPILKTRSSGKSQPNFPNLKKDVMKDIKKIATKRSL